MAQNRTDSLKAYKSEIGFETQTDAQAFELRDRIAELLAEHMPEVSVSQKVSRQYVTFSSITRSGTANVAETDEDGDEDEKGEDESEPEPVTASAGPANGRGRSRK